MFGSFEKEEVVLEILVFVFDIVLSVFDRFVEKKSYFRVRRIRIKVGDVVKVVEEVFFLFEGLILVFLVLEFIFFLFVKIGNWEFLVDFSIGGFE